jgi:hypothetical protein
MNTTAAANALQCYCRASGPLGLPLWAFDGRDLPPTTVLNIVISQGLKSESAGLVSVTG